MTVQCFGGPLDGEWLDVGEDDTHAAVMLDSQSVIESRITPDVFALPCFAMYRIERDWRVRAVWSGYVPVV